MRDEDRIYHLRIPWEEKEGGKETEIDQEMIALLPAEKEKPGIECTYLVREILPYIYNIARKE